MDTDDHLRQLAAFRAFREQYESHTVCALCCAVHAVQCSVHVGEFVGPMPCMGRQLANSIAAL